MSGIPQSVRAVAIGYGLLVAVLLPAAAFWRGDGGVSCWLVLATVSVVVIGLGPWLRGSPRPRLWGRAAQLSAIGVVAVALYRMVDTQAHPPNPIGFALLDAVPYLCAVAIALMLLPGRAGRGAWFGDLDPLILFLTLFIVVGTLALLLSTPRHQSPAETAVLITYVVFDVLIVAILGMHLRRDRDRLGAQGNLVFGGVMLLMVAAVGIGATDVRGYHIPLRPLHAAWLAGLVLVAAAALVPAPAALTADPAQRRIHRPTGTVIVILLVGPALELVDPGFTNVVTLLLVVVVGLLLTETRQRIDNERTIRHAAAALAAAPDVPDILSVTLTAAVRCGDRLDRIVLCADGPGGLRMVSSDPADEHRAGGPDGMRPAEAIALVFGDTGHTMVYAPVAPGEAAPVVLGVAGEDGAPPRARGLLELLVAQAGQAVQRVAVTDELTRRAGEEYFRTLVANASDMILTVDADGGIGYVSPGAHILTAGSEAGSVDLVQALGPGNAREVRELLRTEAGHGGTGAPLHWHLAVGQATLEADVRIADLRADPRVGALVVTMRDVTSQARLYRELHRLAFHDDLTGLGTRAGFAQRYADAATGPAAAPLVLAVDIDGFTELNQLHGRAAGDRVLVAVAERLARVRGYAARVSGGRFALLVDPRTPDDDDDAPGIPDWDADAEARLLHETLSGPLDLDSTRISVTVNVGAATTVGVLDADEALEHAGLAEAEARQDRHRRWRAYDPAMLAAVREHDELRRDLAAAIAEDRLSVHYQPFVDLHTGRVVGFEALARWEHPERGSLMPGDFIPLAEDTGLIGPLGNWILRRAVRDTAGLRFLPGGDRIHVSVNISAQQLADPRFVDEVSASLRTTGLPPGALGLEVVENSVLDHDGDVAVLRELRALGIMLAIDDFGTGHSALSYLLGLPFQALKIDRSFVTAIDGDPRRMGLVRAIVAIADSLGLTVIAEGIETAADRAVLADAGCRFGQGFLFSQPVPLADARELLGRTWPSEC
ncbi:bifunctional diguanylate cyclase/phosphodiesterase [Nocardia sp. NEAU-G5]|uniref:Bifunctional diguanylate cyclase/phosphodiesterase n=1 Tax=Nocardia albiluteola TaxID=2842303 RepID=A0ABS6B622_9NOCA|nr:bifunctional diguanylate cyclase/phosphodiesterase [Nocardia albiluteola]MBU3065765.1 bifunctional diguanylate cyclase/phosphodiesterase [Nocardia albiluteola]